jgi:hypothetical protein
MDICYIPEHYLSVRASLHYFGTNITQYAPNCFIAAFYIFTTVSAIRAGSAVGFVPIEFI